MQTLESLKRSIDSAVDLASVVRTMKTLAAVSIRQYEMAVESLGDYFQTIEDGFAILLWHMENTPQLASPDGHHRTGAVVFGSDQGMCGQFNEQISAYAHDLMTEADHQQSNWPVICVGSRVAGRMEDRHHKVDAVLPVAGSSSAITSAVQDLLSELQDWRTKKRLGRIVLFYNQRRSVSSYQPGHIELLPLNPQRLAELRPAKWPSRTLPTFSMESDVLLSRLVRQYLFVSLFRAMAESLAGENASRIASMQAAEKNIQERLAELSTAYNQRRQTAITEELLDVVTGFEALMTDPAQS